METRTVSRKPWQGVRSRDRGHVMQVAEGEHHGEVEIETRNQHFLFF